MTGWSGDGAPGTGSLREFAIGAVTQHFTRSLNASRARFQAAKEQQLDAMEAFQLSLGRSADFDLAKMTFKNAGVETGKSLFINGTGDPKASGSCGFCHHNAGGLSVNLQNRNFNSGVEECRSSRAHYSGLPERWRIRTDRQPGRHLRQPSVQYGLGGRGGGHPAFFHNNVVRDA